MEVNGFWSYLAIVRKRLWLILLLFALTMSIILMRAWTAKPVYQASVLLQVIPLEPEEVPLYTRPSNVSTADTIDLIAFQFNLAARDRTVALRTIAATQANISAEELLAGLEIKQELGGDLLTVALATGDPKAVQQLVVTHVEKAMEEFRRNRARSSVAAGRFLDAELEAAGKELETARNDLLRFQLSNSLQNLDREIQAEQDTIRTLRAAQENATIEMGRLATLADELDKQSEQALVRAAAAPPTSTAAIAWQQTALSLAAQAVDRRVEMAGQRALQSSYMTQLGQHEANLASLLTLTSRYQQLADVIVAKQDTRDFLVNKAREAQLKESQSLAVGYLQVIGETSVPTAPIPTRTLQIALLGGALSLLAGLILAFVLEFLEQVLRRPVTRRG